LAALNSLTNETGRYKTVPAVVHGRGHPALGGVFLLNPAGPTRTVPGSIENLKVFYATPPVTGPVRVVGTYKPADHSVEGGLGMLFPGPTGIGFANMRAGVSMTAKTFDLSINWGAISAVPMRGGLHPGWGLSHVISTPLSELPNPSACLAVDLC
jgi:hypothetical protein